MQRGWRETLFSGAQWWMKRWWVQTDTTGPVWMQGNRFVLARWPSTGTGCPGRLWSLHPWRYWKTVWRNWFYVALLEQGGWVSWFPEVSFHLIHTVNQSVNDFYKLTSSLFITETSFWYDLRVFIRDTGVISWTHSSTQVLHHLDLSARTEEWNI